VAEGFAAPDEAPGLGVSVGALVEPVGDEDLVGVPLPSMCQAMTMIEWATAMMALFGPRRRASRRYWALR